MGRAGRVEQAAGSRTPTPSAIAEAVEALRPRSSAYALGGSPLSIHDAHSRTTLGLPWLVLCLAFAVHVADEIHGGFLSAYGLALEATRNLFPFLPVPHLGLTVWLGASIGIVALLTALTPLAYRGARGMRTLMLWFVALALANVLGHAGGSLFVGRPMPGTFSTPLLLAAGVYAIVADRRRALVPEDEAA